MEAVLLRRRGSHGRDSSARGILPLEVLSRGDRRRKDPRCATGSSDGASSTLPVKGGLQRRQDV